MVDDDVLRDWFCREVLPLERSLTQFIRRNWRVADDVVDMRHDIYELTLEYAHGALPANARATLFTIARNHLASCARRARIVSFDLVADLEFADRDIDLDATERHLSARDALRRVHDGMEQLSPVSYTHLDVYKRQGPVAPPFRTDIGAAGQQQRDRGGGAAGETQAHA